MRAATVGRLQRVGVDQPEAGVATDRRRTRCVINLAIRDSTIFGIMIDEMAIWD